MNNLQLLMRLLKVDIALEAKVSTHKSRTSHNNKDNQLQAGTLSTITDSKVRTQGTIGEVERTIQQYMTLVMMELTKMWKLPQASGLVGSTNNPNQHDPMPNNPSPGILAGHFPFNDST